MSSEQIVQTTIRVSVVLGILFYWNWWCTTLITQYEASRTLGVGTFFVGIVLTIFATAVLYNKIKL